MILFSRLFLLLWRELQRKWGASYVINWSTAVSSIGNGVGDYSQSLRLHCCPEHGIRDCEAVGEKANTVAMAELLQLQKESSFLLPELSLWVFLCFNDWWHNEMLPLADLIELLISFFKLFFSFFFLFKCVAHPVSRLALLIDCFFDLIVF